MIQALLLILIWRARAYAYSNEGVQFTFVRQKKQHISLVRLEYILSRVLSLVSMK